MSTPKRTASAFTATHEFRNQKTDTKLIWETLFTFQ